jgi:N-acetylglucosamine transport system substrate-binding protein
MPLYSRIPARRVALLVAAMFLFVGTTRVSFSQPVEIEVAVFQGGFGLDFFEQCAREYEQLHPNVKIRLWGHPHVWEQLMPRFSAGKPPDLSWPGWGMNLWELVFGGQLLPWDDYLQQNAYGSDRKWVDTFNQSILSQQRYKGKAYILPHNIGAFGWYYNRKMFRENGWAVPKTYEELLELCEKIKATHVAPVTFTGRYPQYAMQGMFLPWAVSAGGIQVYRDAQNLVPGAWQHPAFLRAAQTIMDMKKRGYFQNGCIGMNHTESQMEFLVGRAAMIMCGTWFHSEMKNVMPADFEAEFMLCPPYSDSKTDGTYVYASVDGQWVLPAKGKNPDIAADFFRYM